eukprot:TRINITY_DN11420_c0_g1_i1.p1 TRINITY_DN11420_c0_g1~~TRINITY_DN11420_c0_g1_i1.p1  ORF type:complete len:161 (-),score=12.65 TRINITY_DN11420_c0_g1_i1:87-569(-)
MCIRDRLYGAQTQRAHDNFPISGIKFSRDFIQALGYVKTSAALANNELELISTEIAEVIEKASQEIIDGKHDEHFVIDIFQTGSGTSTNMNANEVIAHRANELNSNAKVHPNDHVNFGQSSNDVIPVSYTHLRAHETVLDLVCRLLLEKKKKKRKRNTKS